MDTYIRMPVCGTRKLYSYVYNVIVVVVTCRGRREEEKRMKGGLLRTRAGSLGFSLTA